MFGLCLFQELLSVVVFYLFCNFVNKNWWVSSFEESVFKGVNCGDVNVVCRVCSCVSYTFSSY